MTTDIENFEKEWSIAARFSHQTAAPYAEQRAHKTRCDSFQKWLESPLNIEATIAPKWGELFAAGLAERVGGAWIPLSTDLSFMFRHYLKGYSCGAIEPHQSVLLTHNWAAALQGAADYEGVPFRPPFGWTVFEFKISGRSVLVECLDFEGAALIKPYVQSEDGWWLECFHIDVKESGVWIDAHGTLRKDEYAFALQAPLNNIIAAQIRAASVMIDAKAVDTVATINPSRVNARRIYRGQPPLFDHHIVVLKRSKIRSSHADTSYAGLIRLHFRRGYWRHLEQQRRTWVSWCLVGNPDLGFVEKHYTLKSPEVTHH